MSDTPCRSGKLNFPLQVDQLAAIMAGRLFPLLSLLSLFLASAAGASDAAAHGAADVHAAPTTTPIKSCCTGGVVYADCFGFQPGKLTTSIQAALNCTTAHTVVIKNMGWPWIVAPPGKYATKVRKTP